MMRSSASLTSSAPFRSSAAPPSGRSMRAGRSTARSRGLEVDFAWAFTPRRSSIGPRATIGTSSLESRRPLIMETLKQHCAFGGTQGYYRHVSDACGPMELSVFVPPGAGPFPVVFFLSGLTCTADNFTSKAGAQRVAAELWLIVIAPDTSPRGADD